MAEGGIRPPRIRLPKVSLPGRSDAASRPRRRPGAPKKARGAEAKAGNGAKASEAKVEAATEPTDAKSTPAKGKSPEPNLPERMEGLQGWMAEIERKQGRMTYFGIAGLVIAILAAGAALYFGLTAKSDSATKGDLHALEQKVDALQAAATKSSKATQNALNASAAQLQQSIAAMQAQQAQNAANIATLQSQARSGALGKGAAAGTTTPGATTTTTPAKKP